MRCFDDDRDLDEKYDALLWDYQEQSMKLLELLIEKNIQARDSFSIGSRERRSLNYDEILKQALEFAQDGINEEATIDRIIAPTLTDAYNIYDYYPTDQFHYENGSTGEENVLKLTRFLKEVREEKFPQLRKGIIKVTTAGSIKINVPGFLAVDCSRKFNLQHFVEKHYDEISPILREQLEKKVAKKEESKKKYKQYPKR